MCIAGRLCVKSEILRQKLTFYWNVKPHLPESHLM